MQEYLPLNNVFMKNLLIFLVCVLLFGQGLFAQDFQDDLEYSFSLLSPLSKSNAMRRTDENYLSVYRFVAKEMNKAMSMKYAFLYQVDFLFLCTITQNAAQQSILANAGIGSNSVPHYFNKKWEPYISGVKNVDLQYLRDTQLPAYIRLHVAPYESDYALALRSNSLLSWNKEAPEVLKYEYITHKYLPFAYYFFARFDLNTKKEESNELDNDITGNKIYGAIRHLHRPDMEFQRYTNYKDLTDEEKRFVGRVRWRSLINLIDPTMWFWNGFRINNGDKVNFMLGYNMSPFGDYIDQHFWWMNRNLQTHFYLREHENRKTWFPEAGVEFANIQILKDLAFDVKLHGWRQPENLDFNTAQGRWGGAIDASFKLMDYDFIKRRDTYISLNLGVTAKTQGYLLETTSLDKHVDLNIGMSIWFE
jgi:hypothetical protein